MTKKTLVTSLSLAAAALSLATVPVTSVYANEATAPTTGTQATQPFTAELTVRHSGEDKYEALVVTFRGTLDPGDGYVGTSINYRIKDRVTNSYETPEVSFTRYDKGTTSYTPTNDVGLRGLKDGSYAVEFYGDTGKLDGQLLTTTDFEIKREATSEAPAVTPKAEDNTDKKPEVTAPAPKVEETNPDLFGGRDLDDLLNTPMSEIEKEANEQAKEEDDVNLKPEDASVTPQPAPEANPNLFGGRDLNALLDTPMSEIEKEATAQAVEEDDVELKAEDVLVSDKPVVEANPNLFGGRDLNALLDTPMSEIEKEATAQAMEEDDVVLGPEDFLHVATTSKNPPVVVLPTYPLTAAPSVGSAKEDNVPTSTVVTTAKQDKPATTEPTSASTQKAAVVETKQEAKKELPRTGDATWASMMTVLAGMGLVAAAGTLRKRYSN